MANYKTGLVVTGDAKGAVKAVKLTEDQLKALNKTQKTATSRAKEYATQIGKTSRQMANYAGVAGGVAVAAGAALVKQNLATIDVLAKTSDKLGVSTEELTKLRYAAELTGVSSDKLDKSLGKMNVQIADAANGTGEAKDALKSLGLSAEELVNLSPDKSFKKISDALNTVENQTKKSALAYDIFGKSGIDLLNTTRLGADGLDKLGQEAADTGVAISRIDAAKVEAANDAFTRGGALVSSFGQRLTIEVAPILTAVTTELSDAAVEAGGFGQVAGNVVTAVAEGVGVMADGWQGINVIFSALKAGVLGFANISISTLDSVYRAASELANKIPGVSIDYEGSTFAQFATDLGDAYDQAKIDLDAKLMEPLPSTQIETFVADVQAAAETAATTVADNVEETILGDRGLVPVVAEGIKQTNENIETEVEELTKEGGTIDESFKGAGALITGAFGSAWGDTLDGFGTFGTSLSSSLNSLIDSMVGSLLDAFDIDLGGLFGDGAVGNAVDTLLSGGSLEDVASNAVSGFATDALSAGGDAVTDIASGFKEGGVAGGLDAAHTIYTEGLDSVADFANGITNSLGIGDLARDSVTNGGSEAAGQAAIDGAGGFDFVNAGLSIVAGFVGGELGDAFVDAVGGKDARSSWGQTVGALVGSIFSPVGSGVGAFLGSLVDSAFGSGKGDPFSLFSSNTDLDGKSRTVKDNDAAGIISSPFGDYQFRTSRDFLKDQAEADGLFGAIDGISSLEGVIAEGLTPEQIAAVSAAVGGFEDDKMRNGLNVTGFYADRFNDISDAIGGDFDTIFDQATAGLTDEDVINAASILFPAFADEAGSSVSLLETLADELATIRETLGKQLTVQIDGNNIAWDGQMGNGAAGIV